MVYYPFHPLYGLCVEIYWEARHGASRATVRVSEDRIQIPSWMLDETAASFRLSERVAVEARSLLGVADLLEPVLVGLAREEDGAHEAARTPGQPRLDSTPSCDHSRASENKRSQANGASAPEPDNDGT